MRFYKNKQFEMVQTVTTFLKMNQKVVSKKVPALDELITDFIENNNELWRLRKGVGKVVTVAAGRKKSVKKGFIEMMLSLTDMLRAHHYRKGKSLIENETNSIPKPDVSAIHYKRSDFTHAKTEKLRKMGEEVIEAARKVKPLHRYGMTTVEDIKDAEAYFKEYEGIMHAPKARRHKAALDKQELERSLQECIWQLENSIDPLMRLATKDDPALGNKYKSLRIVLPKGRGRYTDKEERYRKSREKKK